MIEISRSRSAGTLLAVVLVVSACGGNDRMARDSAAGTVDTTALDTAAVQTLGATPAIGPLVAVTKTDSRSVRDATQLKLTEENFRRFVQASESLAVLRARDPQVRQLAERDLSGAGSTEEDAGLKLLESNDAASAAIQSAGISVRDYYVMAIAIAAAARYMDTPDAAPPTPVSEDNAEFLRSHQTELARVRELSNGPAVQSGG